MDISNLYIFYGEEQYIIKTNVNKIKKNFGEKIEGINYVPLDETNLENIISEIKTPAFGFPKKLIVLKNTGVLTKEAKTKKTKITDVQIELAKYLESHIEEINDTIVLIIIEEKADKTDFIETMKKLNANINYYPKLKPAEAALKLKQICGMYKVNINENTLQHLINISGTSMDVLINEIRKLIEYAGENGEIDKNAVDLLAIPEIDNIIFNLTDYIGMKNVNGALGVLKDLIYLKEPVQVIIINLYRHFKKLYMIKIAETENTNIALALDLKPNQMFLTTKYKHQARNFTEKELENILEKMWELDKKSKVGNIDLELGLEVLLASIV